MGKNAGAKQGEERCFRAHFASEGLEADNEKYAKWISGKRTRMPRLTWVEFLVMQILQFGTFSGGTGF